MYWPTGSASRLAISSTHSGSGSDEDGVGEDRDGDEEEDGGVRHKCLSKQSSSKPQNICQSDKLLGMVKCTAFSQAQIGLFVTWSAREVIVWNSKPTVALTKLRRSRRSIERSGHITQVRWMTGEPPALVVLTKNSSLIFYTLLPLPKDGSTYKLPSDQSASFLSTGPAERIPLPRIVLKLIKEIIPLKLHQSITWWALLAPSHIIVSSSQPDPQILLLPWPTIYDCSLPVPSDVPLPSSAPLDNLEWLIDPSATFISILFSRSSRFYILITSDGRGYIAHFRLSKWTGRLFHSPIQTCFTAVDEKGEKSLARAIGPCDVNVRFNLISVALEGGAVAVYRLGHSDSLVATYSHVFDLFKTLNSANPPDVGQVKTCSWTSDGHALAISWSNGFSIWSVFGRLQAWSSSFPIDEDTEDQTFRSDWEDQFMGSGRTLLWGPGDYELFILTDPPRGSKRFAEDSQLYILPFAKSAVATLHSPDNTKHAFLQLNDRVSVYRGADSPDMSIINPESDIWQHIKIPSDYISMNYPIRLGCISDDGQLLAVAGCCGFTHFNTVSGRWKLFDCEEEERSFSVQGGMQWLDKTLIVGVEESGSSSVKLFTRDRPLSLSQCLNERQLTAPIVLLSIYENSLLVYTLDNVLHHFLIQDSKLIKCSSNGFDGIINDPIRVRGLSWFINDSQQILGDPINDLHHATIIFLVDGKLIVLKPKIDEEMFSSPEETGNLKYEFMILTDGVEFYWTGRREDAVEEELCDTHYIGNVDQGDRILRNSLWSWDGKKICVWLDVLNLYGFEVQEEVKGGSASGRNSLTIPLSFHPLSVLIDRGVIIGAENEILVKKNLNFAIFRINTSVQLFIHHFIKFYLNNEMIEDSVIFSKKFSTLIYFKHSLEILLSKVLEESEKEAGFDISCNTSDVSENNKLQRSKEIINRLIDFLNKLEEEVGIITVEIIINCMRKIEMKFWFTLFDVVGNPNDLFQRLIDLGRFKLAGSFLLVLHNLEAFTSLTSNTNSSYGEDIASENREKKNRKISHSDPCGEGKSKSCENTIKLLRLVIKDKDWILCKELIRFLNSIDMNGHYMNIALQEIDKN
ncbi:RIC1-domain-containing protein [Phakopsora pachyrhizi]|nr:RIC1-domain-containing protein [Phakopsora pachyrhizi]